MAFRCVPVRQHFVAKPSAHPGRSAQLHKSTAQCAAVVRMMLYKSKSLLPQCRDLLCMTSHDSVGSQGSANMNCMVQRSSHALPAALSPTVASDFEAQLLPLLFAVSYYSCSSADFNAPCMYGLVHSVKEIQLDCVTGCLDAHGGRIEYRYIWYHLDAFR